MAEVAYARGPAFLGARSLSKKNENAEPENAGPHKAVYNENGITKATRALLAITL